MTLIALPSLTTDVSRRSPRIGCCAEFAEPGWRWIVDQLGPPPVDWTFFSTRAVGALEKLFKRPALARYRACRELARAPRRAILT